MTAANGVTELGTWEVNQPLGGRQYWLPDLFCMMLLSEGYMTNRDLAADLTGEPLSVTEGQTEDEAFDGGDEGDLDVSAADGVVLEKNDRSLAEFHRWKQTGRLIVDPEWQRQYVWDRKRASKLIESVLRDIPVPVIYLAKNTDGKYEVIDGLQRLTSVFDFLDNAYPLRGLELIPHYNGKLFRDLTDSDQNKLQDSTLRTFELSPQTPKDLMFVIFERLNTGGIRLNDMEIRNCLFRGKLNTLIKGLAGNEDFLTCVNQRNLERRMSDRTLVLRFLAFYERTHYKARQGLKRFLNEFFEIYRNASDDKLREFDREFKKAMRACVTIFGDKAFRLRREGGTGGNEWAARPNASIFQVISSSMARYDIGQLTRRCDAIFEEYLDLISTDERWVDCVRVTTGDASRIDYVFERWQKRLAEAIGQESPNDPVRAFSKSLKEQLFQQDSTCSICGQSITLIMDAALDHDKHYWRGGKTVPENARLVHRHCNQARPD